MLDHNYIGTEHVLLGLIHEGEGVAARAFDAMNISLEAVRQQVEEIIGRGKRLPPATSRSPRAPRKSSSSRSAKRCSSDTTTSAPSTSCSADAEGEGVAAQVLQKLGADLNRVRQTVIQLLSGYTRRRRVSSLNRRRLAGIRRRGVVLDARRAVCGWKASSVPGAHRHAPG